MIRLPWLQAGGSKNMIGLKRLLTSNGVTNEHYFN